jgi:hypothetical protein
LPNLEIVYYCHVHKLPPLLMNLNLLDAHTCK